MDSENKKLYRDLCNAESSIPHYCRDWWLDIVCGSGQWDVALVNKKGTIYAAMPYFIRRQFGITIITMPPFTQSLGPWFNKLEGSYTTILSRQTEYMNTLIEQLPEFDDFTMGLSPNCSNWLPFYWNNFKQSTAYTYIIPDITDQDKIWQGLHASKRKNIKKASNIVSVKWDLSAEDFYNNHAMTLKKQGATISYSKDLFICMHQEGYKRDAAKTIYALDENNNLHAALFVVWDDIRGYDLISTIDPDYRNSGAASLLIYEVIKWLSQEKGVREFDFEGSMIASVEASFRHMGAHQCPYFIIRKANVKSILLRHFFIWSKRKLRRSIYKQ